MMSENRRELQEFAQTYAMSRIDRKMQYFILNSSPYIKKYNLTNDKAQWSGWEIHMRTEQHDFFVTVLRRKFIAPLMDVFQDIICASHFRTSDESAQQGEMIDPETFLNETHRNTCDSFYPKSANATVYHNII